MFAVVLFASCKKEASKDVYEQILYAERGFATVYVDDVSVLEDQYWTDQSGEAIDYYVDGILQIDSGATLLIDAGTVISFAPHAAIVINNGALLARGTEQSPIYLVGEQASRGWWNGLYALADSARIELNHSEIRDTGSSYILSDGPPFKELGPSSIWQEAGTLKLRDCVLSNGKGFGLIAGASVDLQLSNTSIGNHVNNPLDLYANHLCCVDSSTAISGREGTVIRVRGSEVNQQSKWHKRALPYEFRGSTFIEAGVEIVAGTEFRMAGASAIVVNGGYLKAAGQAEDRIRFRGSNAQAGYWKGLFYSTESELNQLYSVDISDAGNGTLQVNGGNPGYRGPSSLLLNSGRLTVRDCHIFRGAASGFVVEEADFGKLQCSENSITEHADFPMKIPADNLYALDEDSEYRDNGRNEILVSPAVLSTGEHNWKPQGLPFYFLETSEVKTGLRIAAGTELSFNAEKGLLVLDQGYLNASGTSDDPVVFRNAKEANWLGLVFNTDQAENKLLHAEIRNAGLGLTYLYGTASGWKGGANVYVNSGQLQLENSLIAGSADCGIFKEAAAQLTLIDVLYDDNQGADLCE